MISIPLPEPYDTWDVERLPIEQQPISLNTSGNNPICTPIGWVVQLTFRTPRGLQRIAYLLTLNGFCKPVVRYAIGVEYQEIYRTRTGRIVLSQRSESDGFYVQFLTPDGELTFDEDQAVVCPEKTSLYKTKIVDHNTPLLQLLVGVKTPNVIVYTEEQWKAVEPKMGTREYLHLSFAHEETVLIVTDRRFIILDNPLV